MSHNQSTSREQIVKGFVSKLVGAPFLRGGRDALGIDCLGVVLAGLRVLRPDLQIRDPWAVLRETWDLGQIEPEVAFPGDWRDLPAHAKLREGDVLILRDLEGPNHLGLVLGPGHQVLHAKERTGTILTRARRLRSRIVRVMRPPPPAAWGAS